MTSGFIKDEYLRKGLAMDGSMLENIRNPTYDMCLAAVKSHGMALQFVPEFFLSGELCEEAVRQNPEAIQYVPHEILQDNPELVKWAVAHCGKVLDYLLPVYHTLENILAARRENYLLYEEEQKEKIQELEIEYWLDNPDIFCCCHNPSETLCKAMVQRYPRLLHMVPEKYRTERMCRQAFAVCPDVFPCIPEAYTTYEMAKTAIRSEPLFWGSLSPEYKTEELARLAFQGNMSILPELDADGLATKDMWLEAITEERTFFCKLPKELIADMAFVADCVRANPEVIDFATLDYSDEVSEPLRKIAAYGGRLDVVDDVDFDMCLSAVMANGKSLKYVPDEFRTAELCLCAIKECPEVIGWGWVPEELLKDEDFILDAIKIAPRAVSFIKHPTYSLCVKALELDPKCLRALMEIPHGVAEEAVARDISYMGINRFREAMGLMEK